MSKQVIQLKLVNIYKTWKPDWTPVEDVPVLEFYFNHTLIARTYGGDTEDFINGFRKALDVLNEPTVYQEETVVDAERYNGS